MSLDKTDRPERDECGHAECARPPSPKDVLLRKAREMREEADAVELLAHALPGIMPAPAADLLSGIVEAAL